MFILNTFKCRYEATKTRIAEVYGAFTYFPSSRFPACPHSVRAQYPHLYYKEHFPIDCCWAVPVALVTIGCFLFVSPEVTDILLLLQAYPRVNGFFLMVLVFTFIVTVGRLRYRLCPKSLRFTLCYCLAHGLSFWIKGASPRSTSITGAGRLAVIGVVATFVLLDLAIAAVVFFLSQERSTGSCVLPCVPITPVPAPRDVPSGVAVVTPRTARVALEPAIRLDIPVKSTTPAPINPGDMMPCSGPPVAPVARRSFQLKLRSKLSARRRSADQQQEATRYAQSDFLVGFAVGKMARAAGTHVAQALLRNIGRRALPGAGLLDQSHVPPPTPRISSDDVELPEELDTISQSSITPATPKMPSEPESGYASMPASPAAVLGKKGGGKVAEILARFDKRVVQQEGAANNDDRQAAPMRQRRRWIRRVQRLGAKLKP